MSYVEYSGRLMSKLVELINKKHKTGYVFFIESVEHFQNFQNLSKFLKNHELLEILKNNSQKNHSMYLNKLLFMKKPETKKHPKILARQLKYSCNKIKI